MRNNRTQFAVEIILHQRSRQNIISKNVIFFFQQLFFFILVSIILLNHFELVFILLAMFSKSLHCLVFKSVIQLHCSLFQLLLGILLKTVDFILNFCDVLLYEDGERNFMESCSLVKSKQKFQVQNFFLIIRKLFEILCEKFFYLIELFNPFGNHYIYFFNQVLHFLQLSVDFVSSDYIKFLSNAKIQKVLKVLKKHKLKKLISKLSILYHMFISFRIQILFKNFQNQIICVFFMKLIYFFYTQFLQQLLLDFQMKVFNLCRTQKYFFTSKCLY